MIKFRKLIGGVNNLSQWHALEIATALLEAGFFHAHAQTAIKVFLCGECEQWGNG
jgi:hypothetical protein